MKKRCGVVYWIGKLKLKLPLASKEFVATGSHLTIGRTMFVELSTRNCVLAGPPLPTKTISGPRTLTELKSDRDGDATFNVPSTVSLELSQASPAAGTVGTMLAKLPSALPNENSTISSPIASGSPVRFNCRLPP